MLKSESVSGIATNNLVKWDYKAYLRGTLFKQIQIRPTIENQINVSSGSGRIQIHLRAWAYGVDTPQQ